MGWKDAPEVSTKAGGWRSAPVVGADTPEADKPSLVGELGQQLRNLVGGGVRGAGSIGATILYPLDKARDLIDEASGVSNLGLRGLVTGERRLTRNEQRRQDMNDALTDLGVDTGSLAFKTGKIGAEVAGTLGAGGVVANGLTKVPGVAAAAPNLITAIRTGGMSGGEATGLANPLVRAIGGSVNGGVSAGLVNPADAGAGAVIGGVLPGALQAVGATGRSIGRTLRGPEQGADVTQAVQAAREAGYVIPPTQARPTLANRVMEGIGGKIQTAQNASAKNQAVTNAKAARALGLAEDVKITPDVLEEVRSTAGQAYRQVAELPVRPAVRGDSLTNTPAAAEINPAQMVFDLRQARNDATAWYASYGRTASPDALQKAKAASSLASKLETSLEDYAKSVGREDLVPAMVEARKLIAKSYSVEKALNPATGTVDARKLASQLQKGKPLSGDLKDAAEFAARFPRAAQAVEGMGSLPQTSPLDWSLGLVTQNPLALLARPGLRATALSPVVQNRLVQPGNQLRALALPEGVNRAARQAVLLGGSDQ